MTNLEKVPGSLRFGPSQGIAKANPLARVSSPVVGFGERIGINQLGAERRDKAQAERLEAARRGLGSHRVEHRLDRLAMESVADRERTHLPAPLLGRVAQGVELGLGASDHDRARAVDRGDVEAPGPTLNQGLDIGEGCRDRNHRAAGRQVLHQPRPRSDQGTGLVEGQGPGHMGGRELPDRVPEDELGLEPPGLELPVERDLKGKRGRLREQCLSESRVVLGKHHRAQRGPERGVEVGATSLERGPKDRQLGV